MTLLGLNRVGYRWNAPPLEWDEVLDVLTRDLDWVGYCGDVGLLLWLCAVVDPGRIKRLRRRVELRKALFGYPDAKRRSTTELAWVLTGLSHAKLAGISDPDLHGWSQEAYDALTKNQGRHGLFGHLATDSSLAGWVRGRAGTFADQIYPIYALAKYGQAYDSPKAIVRAQECADAITRLQGPDGEWWWHYDSARGNVCRPYPIYSVHQDGMAPMALFALEEAIGRHDYTAAVEHGLRWIRGRRDLRLDMRDSQNSVIWRSLHPTTMGAEVRELFYLISNIRLELPEQNGKVCYECRPYELGWALYALGSRAPNLQEGTSDAK